MWFQKILDWFRSPSAIDLGTRGEREAERFLRRAGYRIISRGVRDDRGEVDLIVVDQGCIVFVEVKTRRSYRHGHPAEAVDEVKQRRLTRFALGWLKRHQLLEYPTRFDVIAVTWPDARQKPQIDHIRNAFPAVGDYQMFN